MTRSRKVEPYLVLRLMPGLADLLKQLHSARVDFSLGDRIAQRAARFMQMMAVMKAALAEIFFKLHKPLLYPAKAQVVQAEGLHAGAVDQ